MASMEEKLRQKIVRKKAQMMKAQKMKKLQTLKKKGKKQREIKVTYWTEMITFQVQTRRSYQAWIILPRAGRGVSRNPLVGEYRPQGSWPPGWLGRR